MFEGLKSKFSLFVGMLVLMLATPTKQTIELVNYQAIQMAKDSKGIADMVLGGIMIAILGFAMLFIGLYVTFVIQTSLPTLNSASYNSTVTSLNTYVTTVFPVLGLSLLIVGFAIIFVALRSGMGGGMSGAR